MNPENVCIKNEFLTITISSLGAEMTSIKTSAGEERLHQPEAVWANQAPVLFPFCGTPRDEVIIVNHVQYPMHIHGFAMNMEFELLKLKNTAAEFKLISDEETKKQYPYDFELYVAYELRENSIDVKYKVKNKSKKKMYFSIGSHEGYICSEGLDEYEIHFEKAESRIPTVRKTQLVPEENLDTVDGHSVLRLSDALFEGSATVIYAKLESDYVYLVHKTEGKKVRVDFGDFANLLVWTVPGSKYVCIEPWCNMPDRTDTPHELKEKNGILSLGAGEEYENHHIITMIGD